ncbi:MAG: peptidylprolyl isomerase [archaeon]
MVIKKGDKVKIEYKGTFDDGTVFDDSAKHGKPLEFEIGAKQVIPGFEKSVIGMKKGEEKEFKLSPEEAYGTPNPDLVKAIPKDKLPKEPEPQVGMVLVMRSPEGQEIPARIARVSKDTVSIDLNHPLAGRNLNFKIKIV